MAVGLRLRLGLGVESGATCSWNGGLGWGSTCYLEVRRSQVHTERRLEREGQGRNNGGTNVEGKTPDSPKTEGQMFKCLNVGAGRFGGKKLEKIGQILLAGATCMLPYRAPHMELAPHMQMAPVVQG